MVFPEKHMVSLLAQDRIVLIEARIRCTTFNVNDKLPPPGTTELSSLVGAGEGDLLVFGFQEVGELALRIC